MVLNDKDFRELTRKHYLSMAKHPGLFMKEIVRKAKFLWWLTGIRKPGQVRRTIGTRFFFGLRRLLQILPE